MITLLFKSNFHLYSLSEKSKLSTYYMFMNYTLIISFEWAYSF